MDIAYKNLSNKPKDIRFHNQRLVLSLFLENNHLSMNQISQGINLSKTSVSKIISEMGRRNLIVSLGKGESTNEGGKKPELYCLNQNYGYAIAINIDNEYLVGGITDFTCKLICAPVYAPVRDALYEEVINNIYCTINRLLQETGISTDYVCSVIIGCDGIVDSEKGIICCSARKKTWNRNLEIRKDVEKCLRKLELNCDLFIDNGCRYIGFSELMYKEVRAHQCIATIYTTKDAIGGSIIQQSQLLGSINGYVGEFGHNIVDSRSRVKCECGNYGCLEALASEKNLLSIVKRKQKLYPNSILFQPEQSLCMTTIFKAVREGDVLAQKVVSTVADYFAILIHNLVMSFDPELVIIQGEYASAGEIFLQRIREKVNKMGVFGLDKGPVITLSKVKNIEDLLTGYANFSIINYIAKENFYK